MKKAGILPTGILALVGCYSIPEPAQPKSAEYIASERIFHHYDASVRYSAVIDACKQKETKSAVFLKELVSRKAESFHIRGTAAYALGYMGDQSASELLKALARDKAEEPTVREGAIVGLGLLKDNSSRPILEAIAVNAHEQIYLRRQAVVALNKISPEQYKHREFGVGK